MGFPPLNQLEGKATSKFLWIREDEGDSGKGKTSRRSKAPYNEAGKEHWKCQWIIFWDHSTGTSLTTIVNLFYPLLGTWFSATLKWY